MIMRISMPNRFRLKKVMGFRTMIRPERGEIHYIGGADILPAPLSLREETEALNKFGTEEEKEAKAELIEHNLRLVVYIAKKFDNTSVGVEDLISIGTIGLIKAINTFNPTKNIKLATYASRCIENEILMYLRRTSKMKLEVSIDEPLNVDWDGNELLLSDILGTEEDVIYKDRGAALWSEAPGWGGDDAERGGGSHGDLPVIYFEVGEEDHDEAEEGNREI